MKKVLIISKSKDIIWLKREDGIYEENSEIKLFTHDEGMIIMAEIAAKFLEPEKKEGK